MLKQTSQNPFTIARQWFLSLAVLSAVSMTREEAEMKVAAYVPMLCDRFPPGAFTKASLEHIAYRAVRGFPTYGELATWLAEWWREHRPRPPAIAAAPAPPRPPLTDEERAHMRRLAAETVAALRANAPPRQQERPTPRYLTPEQLDRLNPLPNGYKRHALTIPAKSPAPMVGREADRMAWSDSDAADTDDAATGP